MTTNPPAGAAKPTRRRTPVTPATDDARKLDALGMQLSTLLVQMASLASSVEELRRDIARETDGRADHEARLRGLEANGCATHAARLDAHESRLGALEQYRWKAAGIVAAATFVGGGGGAGIALVASSLLGH